MDSLVKYENEAPSPTSPNTSTPVKAVKNSPELVRSSNNSTPTQRLHRHQRSIYSPMSIAPWKVDHPESEWRSWPEVRVKAWNLPTEQSVKYLHEWLSKYGNIRFIKRVYHPGKFTLIVFSPPPTEPFWLTFDPRKSPSRGRQAPRFEIEQPRPRTHPSPVDHTRNLPDEMFLLAGSLSFGVRSGDDKMTSFRTVEALAGRPITFTLKLSDEGRRQIDLRFDLPVRGAGTDAYRVEIPLEQVKSISRAKAAGDQAVLLFSILYPPKYYRQGRDVKATEEEEDHMISTWREWDTYTRETDIDVRMDDRHHQPVAVTKSEPYIETGRWLTYALVLISTDHNKRSIRPVCTALDDYNVDVRDCESIEFLDPSNSDIELSARYKTVMSPREGAEDAVTFEEPPPLYTLPFETLYQLEVCVSHNYLRETSLNDEFLKRLRNPSLAQSLLEGLAASEQYFADTNDIFTNINFRTRSQRVPKGCVLVRSATVTPTTVYVHTPNVEVSNRVVRKYIEHSDRFLRVKFADEEYLGKLQTRRETDYSNDQAYIRVKRVLTEGLDIAGRHYEFLAFGNSQFKEHGAFFFAPTKTLSAADIRSWMGSFTHIRVIAKYVSRLGQCLSTTRAITSVGTKLNIQEIPDIEHNGHCFSDGVGKISPFLAQMIAGEFGSGPDYSSVYQFRMGGCKGTLAVDPRLSGMTIQTRPSQKKFETAYQNLEIIRSSSYTSTKLNQQIILILSCLGVPDDVFLKKLRVLLAEVDHAMTDDKTAIKMLQASVDYNQVTIDISKAVLEGFSQDPFVSSLLQLWRAWTIKGLKEKANLPIEDGAFVYGTVDETNTLNGEGEFPEIFLQVPDERKGSYKTVTGLCFIARNPALHPGDIRTVIAVPCEQLRHHKSVVVLPQNGSRDLASMCAGGDLDGDEFLVIYDQSLLPKERNYPPMDYTAPPPRTSKSDVTTADMVKFFCEFMKQNTLGDIAVAHRAHADRSELGVKDPKCIRLAHLHSMAVDYAKTGVPAIMERELRPGKDHWWPHWMGKTRGKSYTSQKILGRIYNEIERVEFRPQYERQFDQRIIKAYELEDSLLDAAAYIKLEWDYDISRIMAQHGVHTEFEVWSAFVMRHNKEIRDYSFAEEMGRLIGNLKTHYRQVCLDHLGLTNHDRDFAKLGPWVAAMYTVTAKEMALFNDARHGMQMLPGLGPDVQAPRTPLMSFPWVFADELGRVAAMSKSASARRHSTQTPVEKKGKMTPSLMTTALSPFGQPATPTTQTNAFASPANDDDDTDTARGASEQSVPGATDPYNMFSGLSIDAITGAGGILASLGLGNKKTNATDSKPPYRSTTAINTRSSAAKEPLVETKASSGQTIGSDSESDDESGDEEEVQVTAKPKKATALDALDKLLGESEKEAAGEESGEQSESE